MIRLSPRAVFEAMTRGDLIDALMASDASPSPKSARRLEALEVERGLLSEELEMSRDRSNHVEIARARFEDLFSNAPVAYCVLDRDGVVSESNDAASALFCASRSALDGVPLTQVVGIAERQRFLDHIARCLAERLRVISELTISVRGRGDVAVQLVSTPGCGDAASAPSCRTVFHDVTRERRASAANEFLLRVDDAINEAPETVDHLALVAQASVPMLGGAVFIDRCEGNVRRVAMAVAAPYAETASAPIAHHADEPSWQAYVRHLLARRAIVFDPTSAAAFSVTLRASAFLLVPIAFKAKALGVLGALRFDDGTFDVRQLELAHKVARRVARVMSA